MKGFEALARWWHPARGEVSPSEFIPVAEQTGLIVEIGDWVLRRALRAIRPLLPDLPTADGITISVNLSAAQVADPMLVERVTSALHETDFPATSLILEITETSAVQTGPESVERLWTLKRMGIRLAIDDFGTGYASLSYLQRFPISISQGGQVVYGNSWEETTMKARSHVQCCHSAGPSASPRWLKESRITSSGSDSATSAANWDRAISFHDR